MRYVVSLEWGSKCASSENWGGNKRKQIGSEDGPIPEINPDDSADF